MKSILRSIALATALAASLGLTPAPAPAATVPFAGQAQGQVTSFAPGPAGVAITVSAQGKATHLGLFTREEQILLDPVAGTFTGTIVFVAANGDQLSGTLVGAFVTPGTATGYYTFTSGTGRFSGAGGDVDFVLSSPDGVHFSASFDGSLDK